MKRRFAMLSTAALLGVTGAPSATAATYPTAAVCNGNGGKVWLRTWSGKVATSGAHKGYWPIHGWMSGQLDDMNSHLSYHPTNLSLGGRRVPVAGVQTTWVRKGYVVGAQAVWQVTPMPSGGRSWSITCTTPSIRAAS